MKRYLLPILTMLSLQVLGVDQKRSFNLAVPNYPVTTKPITQSMLSSTATNLYTLQQPGRYFLDTPLEASPSVNDARVLKITSSNVVLDLNGMTISQAHSSTQTGLNGIDIASNVSNITIMNGFINNLSDAGINVASGCSGIKIVNVAVNNCDGGGIQFDTVTNIYLENVDTTNCDGSGTSAPSNRATGLFLTGCTDFTFKNCNFSYNVGSGRNGRGVAISSCSNGFFLNCNFSSNSGLFASGGSITSCNALNFENCKFNNNSSSAGTAYGLVLTSCNATIIKNSDFSYNRGTGDATYGLIFATSTRGSLVENCTANYNTGNSTSVDGIRVQGGNGDIIRDCKCIGNNGTGVNTNGIAASSSTTGLTIENCICAKNTATTSGQAYGIHFSSGVTNCVVKNNILLANTAAGTSGNRQYGFVDDTDKATGTTTMLGGNISYAHGTCNLSSSTQINGEDPDANLNYYFELAGTLDSSNEPLKMINEIKLGRSSESGVSRVTTSGHIGTFGTFDNMSFIQ